MKVKYILLSLLTLFVLGAGYYSYTRILEKEVPDAWSFVPSHAVWVYETSRGGEVWESLQEQPAGKVLQQLPVFKKTAAYRNELDSLTGGRLKELMENRRLLSSLHITGKNSFDYLFYIPVQGPGDYDVLKRVLDTYRRNPAYLYGKRVFNGFEIEEVTLAGEQQRFSFLLHQNYLIASFTPFLLEDVIRQLSDKEKNPNFRQQQASLFQLSAMEADEGNLYLNGARLGAFINLFLRDSRFPDSFSFASRLDVAVKQEGILLNGYTAPGPKDQNTPYLNSLVGEEPQTLGMAHLLPLQTAFLQFYGFSEGASWHQSLQERGVIPSWRQLPAQYSEAEPLLKELGTNVALARWRNPGEEVPQQLLYIELKNGERSFRQWELLAQEMSQREGDSLYQEVFGEHTITLLPYEGFPEAFFGADFTGFKESFFVQLDNYLVLGSSMQGVKSMLLDVERDNTWRKSVPVYQFLEKTNQEMNWGLFVNVEQAWRQLVDAAEPEWKSFLEKQGPYLRQFNRLAIQLSALDDLFYTNVLLEASPQDVKELQQIRFTTIYTTRFDAPLITRPMLVQNSKGRNQKVLVQDSLFMLHLLDIQGDRMAADSLAGPLVTDIFQLETAKKGVLGYMAVTANRLYLYDGSFQVLPDFPVILPEGADIRQANVIDYDGSKNYRLLLSTASGEVYMFDTRGKMLEGWQPRELGGALNAAPGHVRIRGKDVIYAFQQKGVINLLNRRGESYKGFPLNLQDSLLGPVLIRPGSDFESTRFTTISKNGELLSFNMLGQIVEQQQLFKPEANTVFRLVADKQENSFLIVRQSRNSLSLLDPAGELLFEKNYLGAARTLVQYFNFGADKEIIAITDPQEEFTFLYDKQGNLLNAEPLNSCCPISMEYLEKERAFHVYKGYENQLIHLKIGN